MLARRAGATLGIALAEQAEARVEIIKPTTTKHAAPAVEAAAAAPAFKC